MFGKVELRVIPPGAPPRLVKAATEALGSRSGVGIDRLQLISLSGHLEIPKE
jgi:hypothetical protein